MDKCPLCKKEIEKVHRVLMRTHSGKRGITYPMHGMCMEMINQDFTTMLKKQFGDDFKGE